MNDATTFDSIEKCENSPKLLFILFKIKNKKATRPTKQIKLMNGFFFGESWKLYKQNNYLNLDHLGVCVCGLN